MWQFGRLSGYNVEGSYLSEIRYSRGMSPRQVAARGLSVMVIVTAFVLTDETVTRAGPLTPLAFFGALVLLLVNLLGYVELAVSGRRWGSAYGHVHEAGDSWLGFFTGWASILSGMGLCALLARGFGVHVGMLFHDHLNVNLPAWLVAASLILLVAANNAVGTREGRRGSVTASLVLIALLAGVTLLALPRISLSNFRSGPRAWEQAIPVVLAAYAGLEITATLQNEMRDRARSAPLVLLLTPLLSTLIAVVIAFVSLGVVGWGALSASRSPLALLGDRKSVV